MSPWEVMGWALATLVIGIVAFCLYALVMFGVRLTQNFLLSKQPEPPVVTTVNIHDPDAIRNGIPVQPVPVQQPQPRMWPAQR